MQPRIFLERTAKILSQILLDDEKEKDEQLQLSIYIGMTGNW
jgi:hypothetical protein